MTESVRAMKSRWERAAPAAGAAAEEREIVRRSVRAEATSTASTGWAALAMALLVTAYLLIVVFPIFGLAWRDLADGVALRLATGLLLLLAALRLWVRGADGADAAAGRQTALVRIAATLLLCLVPIVLWATTGSIPLLRDSFWAGIASLGVLAVVGRSGRGAVDTQARPRWKPALVALIAILPAVVLSFLVRDVLSSSNSFAMRLLAEHSSIWDAYPSADPWRFLGALLTMPCALLLLFQLLRVAALRQPLRSGLARGIRQTAPAAVAMLLAVYLVALVPTIARDRAAERLVEQMLTDQIRYTPALLPSRGAGR